jgi:hypothetical protein
VKPYLSIGAIYRNEAPYLREWIEFHRLVGVERFFLYNNHSTDDHMDVLRPYIEAGTVVWEDFPGFPPQLACYQQCVETHRDDTRWIAFIDIDEFLFSPTGRPLPEVLARYENWGGVGVNRVTFGTSGHEQRPSGLVLENYTRRIVHPDARKVAVKSIVDPRRAVRALDPHHFEFRDGGLVDEAENPLDAQHSVTDTSDVLRVNHYFTRSEEERVVKLGRPRAGGGKLRPLGEIRPGQGIREDRRFGVPDDAILTHLPALKAELARVAD